MMVLNRSIPSSRPWNNNLVEIGIDIIIQTWPGLGSGEEDQSLGQSLSALKAQAPSHRSQRVRLMERQSQTWTKRWIQWKVACRCMRPQWWTTWSGGSCKVTANSKVNTSWDNFTMICKISDLWHKITTAFKNKSEHYSRLWVTQWASNKSYRSWSFEAIVTWFMTCWLTRKLHSSILSCLSPYNRHWLWSSSAFPWVRNSSMKLSMCLWSSMVTLLWIIESVVLMRSWNALRDQPLSSNSNTT